MQTVLYAPCRCSLGRTSSSGDSWVSRCMRWTSPHESFAAGAIAIAAGVYELTPVKQHFRRRCRESVRSGFEFGLSCVGSSLGLMLMLVALSVMSVTWMALIPVLLLAHQLLPATAPIHLPLA